MSELPVGIEPARPPEPRESALGIVVRRAPRGTWEVLVGRRARRARFLPGHVAFPGGSLEPEDGVGGGRALRRCASREVWEEMGVEVPPAAWADAGERTTPPLFPVRFRTRFFLAEVGADLAPPENPVAAHENEDRRFAEPRELLRNWERGNVLLPPPLIPILEEMTSSGEREAARLAERIRLVNERENAGSRIEFVKDVWMFPMASATLPPATHTNAWLPGGGHFAVIDPGSDDPDEVGRLLHVVRRRADRGATPACVLLTHHHRDHTAGAAEVARALKVPVRAHPEVLERIRELPGSIPRQPVAAGEILDLAGLRLKAHLTPGHAPGHLAFQVMERDVLISGDLASAFSTIVILPPEGDMGVYLDSLERMRKLGCSRLLPAHGPPLPLRALDRLIEHRHQREAKILAALRPEPRPLAEIAREAYADTPEAPALLAERQTLAHLLLLERNGKANPATSDGTTWRL